eukprot:scaffold37433_cov33-Tisochrysis_lutea.AAC.2
MSPESAMMRDCSSYTSWAPGGIFTEAACKKSKMGIATVTRRAHMQYRRILAKRFATLSPWAKARMPMVHWLWPG